MKSLRDTLENVDASATRPATPTVAPFDEREKLESRGSGDTYVRGSKWAEWFVKKEFDKKRREESERKKRAEMKEKALQEEKRNLVLINFQEWLQVWEYFMISFEYLRLFAVPYKLLGLPFFSIHAFIT